MKKVETEKYKDYTIEVYEQAPNVEYPLNENDWDNLDPRKNFQRAVIDMFAGTEQIYINCSTGKGGVYY